MKNLWTTIQHSEHVITGFHIENLDNTMKHLEAMGVPIHEGPISPLPSIRFIYIKDPNGYMIQLVEGGI